MADLAALQNALVNADKAGDTAAATALANEITRMQAAPQKAPRTVLDRWSGAIGEAAGSLITGSVAAPIAGLAGMVGGALPGPQGQSADFVRKTQDALTMQPRSEEGGRVLDVATKPFQWLEHGANRAGEVVAEKTGSPMAGAAVNTALQAAPALIAKGSASLGSRGLATDRLARLGAEGDTKNALAVPFNDAVRQAREAGYVIPPTQVNRTAATTAAEGLGGEAKVAKLASLKNQGITDNLIRKDFGIAEDQPLGPKVFNDIRKKAGQDYGVISDSGKVAPSEPMRVAAERIAEPYRETARDFPDLAEKGILDAVNSVQKAADNGFNAKSGVKQISLLREKASKAYMQGDKSLGGAYRDLAGAIEEELGRHLEISGAPKDVIAKYQQARKTIAKSYAAEDALIDDHIDATALARKLQNGAPFDGGMKTVAEFASRFGKAAKTPQKTGGVPLSFADYGLGGLGGVAGYLATGHAPSIGAALAGTAALAARPAMRSLVLSRPGQALVQPPTYAPGLSPSVLAAIEQNPALLTILQGQQR